jgi:hypothetical protein
MANFGWIYLISAGRLAGQKVKVHMDQQFYLGQAIQVKHVTPAALDRPGELRNLLDWIDDEMEHGQSQHGEGPYLVTEFFLAYGTPGVTQVAQFEPEWMFIDDLSVLSSGSPAIRERLGLGIPDAGAMIETTRKAWEAQARTLPRAIKLLRRLPGWCFLSHKDMERLMDAFEGLPEDELHFPGEWEAVYSRHRTQDYDFAAFLFEGGL